MIVSSSALVANLQSAAQTLGATLPAEFTSAVSKARALPRDIDYSGAIDQQNHAALQALLEDRDPTVCPQVQKWVVARSLNEQGLRAAAERWAGETITELIHTHADAILTAIANSVRGDLDVLQAAAGQLDLADLNVTDPILLKRNGLLNVWADASNAAERAEAGLSALRSVLRCLNYGYDGETAVLLLAPDADWPTCTAIAARAGRHQLSAWSIARGGTALELPTLTGYVRAVARVTAERQERERQAEADAEEESRTGRQRQRQWTRVR